MVIFLFRLCSPIILSTSSDRFISIMWQ
jgi:hypothetical protein